MNSPKHDVPLEITHYNYFHDGVQSREEALEMLNYIRECLEQGTFPT